jgi:hypothetical protein
MSFFEPPARPKVSPGPWWSARRPGSGHPTTYPAGFSFTLHLRLGNLSAREERQLPYLLDRADLDDDPLADDVLRFGLQFADGGKATTLDHPPHDPEGPSARPAGAERTRRGRWRHMEYWVWPLAPAGPFAFVRGRAEASRTRAPRSTPECFSKRPVTVGELGSNPPP